MAFIKRGIFVIVVVALFAAPSFGNAQTSDTQALQTQISALLQQIQALQQQLVQDGGGSGGGSTPSQPTPLPTVPTFPTVQPQNIPSFNRDLYLGLRNNADVSDLQEFLTEQGYYAGPISSNYALLTLSAVKKFQQANGITPASGYFGPKTRALANKLIEELVGQICGEEGCDNDILPPQQLTISVKSLTGGLDATVGEYFAASFIVGGGSGNYEIDIESKLPAGLSLTRTYCPPLEGSACTQVISQDSITLFGTPQRSGVYDIRVYAREIKGESYGKERFTIIVKDKVSIGRLPVISGVKGPTILKVGEEGIWEVNAQDRGNGSLNYRVVWGDEYKGEAAAPSATPQRAIPFRQTATFAHTYYNAGVYNPTFYVVNDRGSEARTSITVNVAGQTISAPIYSVEPAGTLVRGQRYDFRARITNGQRNARVLFFLQRPDGTMKYSGITNLGFTDVNGYLYTSSYELITNEGQNGTWTSWVTVGGVESNRIYRNVQGNVSSAPSITVTSPNGGEVWAIGSTQSVNWRVDGTPPPSWTTNQNGVPDVILSLFKGEQFLQFLSNAHGGGAPFHFVVPNVAPGNDYKVKVSARGSDGVDLRYFDSSEKPFSIVAAGAQIVSAASAEIIGSQSTYASGQTIKFSVKGLASDGSIAAPAKGFNVQAWMQKTNPIETVQIGGVYQSFNANYDSNSGLWNVTMTAPSDASQTYKIEAALYCSNSSLGCSSGQINKSFTFTVAAAGTPSITVTSPNGGESFRVVDTIKVRWSGTSQSQVDRIWLIESQQPCGTGRDGECERTWGLSPLGGTENDGYYEAILPLTVLEGRLSGYIYNYYVRVILKDGTSDTSDSSFSIVAAGTPSITVLSPNGGEVRSLGSTQSIRWTSSNVTRVSLDLVNSAGGLVVKNLVNITGNPGSVDWVIPAYIEPGQYWMRVGTCPDSVVSCITTGSIDPVTIYDTSDAPFTIAAAGSQGSSIRSGLCVGLSKAYGETFVDVDAGSISLNDRIFNVQAAPGVTAGANRSMSFYAWVPDSYSTAQIGTAYTNSIEESYYKPRGILVATVVSGSNPTNSTSQFGGVIQSVTNYAPGCLSFARSVPSVPSVPSITVTSPNGGERLAIGSTRTVSWRLAGQLSSGATIELRKDGQSYQPARPIGGVGSGLLSFQWQVPETISTGSGYNVYSVGSGYRVRVYETGNPANYDESDASFSIAAATSVSPTDSDNSPDYTNSISYPITPAKYPDLFTKGVGTGIYAGSSPTNHAIYGSEPNPSTPKPTSNAYSTFYDYCANSSQLNEAFAQSDGKLGAFGAIAPQGYVCANGALVASSTTSTSSPSITVTSPNGGEVWQVGSTQTIRWISAGISSSSSIKIGYYAGQQGGSAQIMVVPNTGIYTWTIPTTQQTRNDYRIAVEYRLDPNTEGVTAADSSNSPFSIAAATTTLRLDTIGNKSVTTGQELNFLVSASGVPDGEAALAASPLPAGAKFLPLGDTTLNGGLSSLDATYILQYLEGSPPRVFSAAQRILADVNRDGTITKADSDLLLNIVVGNQKRKNVNVFSWTPTQAGTYPVTFSATAGGNTVQEAVTISVAAPSSGGGGGGGSEGGGGGGSGEGGAAAPSQNNYASILESMKSILLQLQGIVR